MPKPTQKPHNPYRDDKHLWLAYWKAKRPETKKKYATLIVEKHLPFIKQYSNKHKFSGWSSQTQTDYYHELVAYALRKGVPTWQPDRGTTFISWLRNKFDDVAWNVDPGKEVIAVSKWHRRLRATAEGYVSRIEMTELRTPTIKEISDYVSSKNGKYISEKVIRSMLARPLRATSTNNGDDGLDLVANLPDTSNTDVLDKIIVEELQMEVTNELLLMGLTPFENALVCRMLMSENGDKAKLAELANEFKIPLAVGRQIRNELLVKLRETLKDYK